MANDNKPMLERIDASPEEIAEIVLKFRPPPPGEWKYQKEQKEQKEKKKG